MKNNLKHHPVVKRDMDRIHWKKIDPMVLIRYIKKNPDYKLKDLAKIFDCTVPSIYSALKILDMKKKQSNNIKKKKLREQSPGPKDTDPFPAQNYMANDQKDRLKKMKI